MTAKPPTMTIDTLARLINQTPEALAGNLEPAEGLRVWPSGIGTVHHRGRVQLVVADRKVHVVEEPP